MKKIYPLFIALIMLSGTSVAQSIQGPPGKIKTADPKLSEAGDVVSLKHQASQKAFEDTIFYEDFDSLSVATNWTIVDNSGNNFPWVWAPANQAPGGQFSTNVGPLNSATNANGFMQLRADFFNTPTPGSFIAMDTYFQSPAIDLRDSNNNPRNSVIASWQQSVRYCCSAASELVIEVSTDGLTWTSFDATADQGGNTVWPNGESNEVNLSGVLAGENTAYIRFRSSINTHYYWQIDDLLLFEGPANNVELTYTEINFHPNYPLVPQYYTIPLPNLTDILFEGAVFNGGGKVATGVDFNVDIESDSLIGGGPGTGLVYSASAPVGTGTLQPLNPTTVATPSAYVDTGFITNPFSPSNPAYYSLNYSAGSDSINQAQTEALDLRQLTLTSDTIVALERGEDFFQGTTGPGGFASSGGVGDVLAALVIIEDTAVVKGVRFWVSNARAADIAGISLSPRIYAFDQSQVIRGDSIYQALDSGIVGVSCQSPFSTLIDTCTVTCPPNQPSIMDSWIDLNFVNQCLLVPGTYYFGVEQTAGAGEIWTGRDRVAEDRAVLWSNIMFLSGAPGWGFGGFVSGIRLIADWPNISSLDERKASILDFELYPNPNEGLFTMEISNNGATTYMMNVRNMVGQTVMSEAINVNGKLQKDLDLTSFEKGVYFVTLENGEDRIVRKVVVK
jgi:hypothetical protein